MFVSLLKNMTICTLLISMVDMSVESSVQKLFWGKRRTVEPLKTTYELENNLEVVALPNCFQVLLIKI